jgi:hypothetical protein
MKNFVFLLIVVAVATLFISSPTLVGAELCSSGEGECANPDVDAPEVAAETSPPVETEDTPPPAVEEDPNCPSRELIIRCCGKHLDHNKNGKLDRDELQGAIDSLPWYARGILQILGSVDKMVCVCVCVCAFCFLFFALMITFRVILIVSNSFVLCCPLSFANRLDEKMRR